MPYLFHYLPIPYHRLRDIGHHLFAVLIENLHRRFADAVVRIAAFDARDAELSRQNIIGEDRLVPLNVRGQTGDERIRKNLRLHDTCPDRHKRHDARRDQTSEARGFCVFGIGVNRDRVIVAGKGEHFIVIDADRLGGQMKIGGKIVKIHMRIPFGSVWFGAVYKTAFILPHMIGKYKISAKISTDCAVMFSASVSARSEDQAVCFRPCNPDRGDN